MNHSGYTWNTKCTSNNPRIIYATIFGKSFHRRSIPHSTKSSPQYRFYFYYCPYRKILVWFGGDLESMKSIWLFCFSVERERENSQFLGPRLRLREILLNRYKPESSSVARGKFLYEQSSSLKVTDAYNLFAKACSRTQTNWSTVKYLNR